MRVCDIEGPWEDPDFESSLIDRCRKAWDKEIDSLTNSELATFLRQKIAVDKLRPIALERIAENYSDGTEIDEDELKWALEGNL